MVFATEQNITVDGAANNHFTWTGQGSSTLVGTNGDGVTVTVTIGEVKAGGTVSMKATRTIYDAADAYIDGGRGFDILLANKGTGSLGILPVDKVQRVEMLIRSEREDDVKNLGINQLASLEMYGIILGGTEGAWTVGLNGNWAWSEAKGAWVYSNDEGSLLSLEVAGGVKVALVTPASQMEVETVALADDASTQAYLGEEAINDSPLDADGSGASKKKRRLPSGRRPHIPMRILFISNYFPGDLGPLARELAAAPENKVLFASTGSARISRSRASGACA
ncbi:MULTISPECIES: hypothetical protein [unclassified Desulfovibrio]|uniref:hypothetical protein n=1 Tax=unclassified Desulfovibrio TaxID=2593640 RepID=UPI0013ED13DC|nr:MULTISPECIES: hypothetical protein [unclassified Desulfovibrio]